MSSPTLPDLPGDAQGVTDWQVYLALRPPRRMTSLRQWPCARCGRAIFAGETLWHIEGNTHVCDECVTATKEMER